jgi:hypothetical protein
MMTIMRTVVWAEAWGHFGRRNIGGKARGDSRISSAPVLLFLLLCTASLVGCTLTVPLVKPVPSQFQYVERRDEPVQVVVRDARPAAERKLSKGKLPVEIGGVGEDLSFLSEALVAEMKARGINAMAGAADDANALLIEVDRFYFRHHRASGFSPWVTFTNFRARAAHRGRPETVTSYFYAAKIPMWSMSEVFEPAYNYPWSVVVREVVTKLNRLYFHTLPPADAVRQKVGAIEAQPVLETIMDLGFLGSPEGLPALESLVKTSSSGNVVFYALDAIGIIGDPKSFPFLHNYYGTSRDKGQMLCLKAIGDLGTPEALSFVKSQNPGNDDNLKEIIDLYSY